MAQPLSALKVLDLTHVLAGPFCTYLMALHGADVLKIEPPDEPDCVRGRGADAALNAKGMGTTYLTQGSNKRAMALDLKTAEGKAIFLRLLSDADVLVENFRVGAMAQLGLGHDALRRLNPRLIVCSLTGFGQTGAHAEVNAYDNVIQAASGMMAMTGPNADTPTKTGPSIVDYASGLAGAFAVLVALRQRDLTGEGCHIDCSMLDSALMMMGTQVTGHFAGAESPAGKGNNAGESGLGCYDALDGRLMLGAFNRRQHRRLWNALDRPDFAAHSTWEAMAAHADEMRTVLKHHFSSRSVAELEAWLHGIGVPAERVRTVDEAIALADGQGRNTMADLTIRDSRDRPVRVPLAPFSMTKGSAAITAPPPRHGEHTHAVLSELGFSDAEVEALRAKGVV